MTIQRKVSEQYFCVMLFGSGDRVEENFCNHGDRVENTDQLIRVSVDTDQFCCR